MATDPKEQRGQKRIQFDSRVQVSILNEKNMIVSNLKQEGVLHDLSAGGCAFYQKQRLQRNDRLQVRIVLNEQLAKKFSQTELTARGKVVRIVQDGDRYLVSMSFLIDV